jgi:hypothetical protein
MNKFRLPDDFLTVLRAVNIDPVFLFPKGGLLKAWLHDRNSTEPIGYSETAKPRENGSAFENFSWTEEFTKLETARW